MRGSPRFRSGARAPCEVRADLERPQLFPISRWLGPRPPAEAHGTLRSGCTRFDQPLGLPGPETLALRPLPFAVSNRSSPGAALFHVNEAPTRSVLALFTLHPR